MKVVIFGATGMVGKPNISLTVWPRDGSSDFGGRLTLRCPRRAADDYHDHKGRRTAPKPHHKGKASGNLEEGRRHERQRFRSRFEKRGQKLPRARRADEFQPNRATVRLDSDVKP